MQRAAVLIGVAKTGQLQTLQAVHQGVESIRKWALLQSGMGDRVVTLTDANGGAVSADEIKKVIRKFVDLGTIEQLFVYFAGHGVNLKFHEFWLLSDAPEDPQAAVNVDGSVSLARHCGIPHVVLISDACRTAAESIQAQAVEGSSIFPNTGPRDVPGSVDVFYAAAVGRPAYEVRDPAEAARGFQAIYTNALIDGLSGARAELLEADAAAREPRIGRVRPWPLKRYLQLEVPTRLVNMGAAASQSPDAVITSEPEAWLAEMPMSPVAAPEVPARVTRAGAGRRPGRPLPKPASDRSGVSPAAPETLVSISQRALRSALGGTEPTRRRMRGARPGQRPTRSAEVPVDERAEGFEETVERRLSASEPGHFETQCGFKVIGTAVTEVLARRAKVELLDGPAGVVRVSQVDGPAASVLLVFADGCGALLPAIPDFVASATYEKGELINVTYEPSSNTWRWGEMQARLSELRSLRAVIASAASFGTFRLEGKDDVPTLIERMRAANGVDPTMAAYAAYALNDLGQQEAVESMQRFLREDLKLTLFDVALLAAPPRSAQDRMPNDTFPAVPLLSQGWALLDAYCIVLPAALRGVQQHVTDSLWTLFNEQGVAAVRAAFNSGEVD